MYAKCSVIVHLLIYIGLSHVSCVISVFLSSRVPREEEETLSLLQAAAHRAGERVSIQRLHQQGQTHAAVPPSAPDRSVRACWNIFFKLSVISLKSYILHCKTIRIGPQF